ncbi:MAG: DUF5305 family protein [Sedimentibacter sp.]
MKFKIKKNIRIGLIIISVTLISVLAYLTYNRVSNPGFEEQNIPVYSYTNNASLDYTVFLKPNNLYNDNKLEEGKIYITEFVDYIDTNLKYEFTGERAADIKGEYNVTAKVQGFTGEGEKIINIWEKDFPVLQYKLINTNDGKVSINERVKLNLYEYNIFVKEIKEASKINCQATLTLYLNVDLAGSKDELPIKESISPSLIIPLDTAMFGITENNIKDQSGAIEKTVQVPLSVNKIQVLVFGIILAVLIAALIILLFFTQISLDKNPLEKVLNKIFKKHGNRLVAISSDIEIKNSIIVKSIDDLVKIADEIGKPILYKYSDNYREINKFYVSNEDEIYVLDLGYLIVSEQFEEVNDTASESSSVQVNAESQSEV